MLRITALSCLILGVAVGCGDDDDMGSTCDFSCQDHDAELSDAVANYADIVLASYEDSLEKAVELDDAINAFLDDPSAAKLDAARNAWRDAREPYLQTEVYRFYDGPIDNADDGVE